MPLFTTLNLQCANGIISTVSKTESDTISNSQAENVAQAISYATTKSASWSLSKDWNESTQVSQSYAQQKGRTQEESESLAKTQTGTYSLTNSSGGSHSDASTSSGTFSFSANNGHSNTNSATYERGSELTSEIHTDVTAEMGVKYAGISAGVSANVGAKAIDKDSESLKLSNSGTRSASYGVDFSNQQSSSSTNSKTWNTASSYATSDSTSQSKSVSTAVSELISSQYGYGSSYSTGGSNSESQALAKTDTESNEYSTSLTYSKSKITSTTTEFSSTGNTKGGYRMVMAGTVHVFAVVGYDVAKQEYFVYTYNVLDDSTSEYLDYSYDESFDDYETSVIPFEVPYFVNEYVNSRITKTNGLVIDVDTGRIVDYHEDSSNPSTIINIPSYISIDNNDGTRKSVKVTGIDADVFKNNKNIVGIGLGNFITEIPDSAFEGCTSLKYINCPAVRSIGKNAFKGCSSLTEFIIPAEITQIGEKAFDGVDSINATASNANVAQRIAESGANKITLDISVIPETEAKNMVFTIGRIASFELQGKDKEYKGLGIKSDAATTIVNGVTFTENSKIPMELSSANVTLDRVTVDCAGYSLVLKSDNTNVKLNRTINLHSNNGNTVLCKNIELSNLSNNVAGKLNVIGNVLICGSVTGDRYLTITDGQLKTIIASEFENYLSSHMVSFDANGGTVNTASKMVPLNTAIGELPKPDRDFYTFAGWYTEANGGIQVTSDTIMTSLSDMTLYAHWTHNSVSAWTLASSAPADAEIVSRKYKYDLTSYTTSSSSSLSGWTKYNTTWTWSSYGGWSGWSTSNPGSSESREVGTRTTYKLFRYTCYDCKDHHPLPGRCSAGSYGIGNVYSHPHTCGSASSTWDTVPASSYEEMWIDTHPNDNGWLAADSRYRIDCRGYHNVVGECWWYAWWWDKYNYTRTEYRYRDRSKIYTYYYQKTDKQESTTYPSGSNISNVQEWVQYRVK